MLLKWPMFSSAFPMDLWDPLRGMGRGLPTAICLGPQAGNESQERVGTLSWLPFSTGPASLGAGLWRLHFAGSRRSQSHYCLPRLLSIQWYTQQSPTSTRQRGKLKPFLWWSLFCFLSLLYCFITLATTSLLCFRCLANNLSIHSVLHSL